MNVNGPFYWHMQHISRWQNGVVIEWKQFYWISSRSKYQLLEDTLLHNVSIKFPFCKNYTVNAKQAAEYSVVYF